MDQSVVIWALLSLFTSLISGPTIDDELRKLRGKVEYFRAKIEDLETSSMMAARGKKRKRNDDLGRCIAQGRVLATEVQSLLSQLEEGSPELKRQDRRERGFPWLETPKNIIAVRRSCGIMAAHEREVDKLLTCSSIGDVLADHGQSLGNHIPAKPVFGQVASTTMYTLQRLLLDPNVSRITILGAEGLGKTALMKHLHNFAIDEKFNYVFWVTCAAQSSIAMIQNAVAAAVGCDISHSNDLILRARELSDKLTALGEFVLFMDAVPEAVFSLEEIGIRVPSEAVSCKLVITTRSDLVCRPWDCSAKVQVKPLSEEEALGLFMQEAGIDLRHVYLLEDIPKLVANVCGGVPSKIVNTANQMRHIYDIREWRNMLFELQNHGV